ncbi:MAG: phosphate/phosphite/phosphonate ABC transporter substrate-binding protein [Proteobacteria bacterium]|nr:phosphate/phosphite/phosphonate ABC transporter substrate-binding protein [Pseudomonadota bacterium]
MALMRTARVLFIISCFIIAISAGLGSGRAESSKGLWQENPLLIGLIPEQNLFKQVERYEPLADYLSQKCGVEIRLKILTRYGNIVSNFVSLGMDGAFFGSFTYALAHIKLGVEVLARPEGLDGTSTYHGLIFVRQDSGIKSIRDMKGKTFAFVDRATMAGYLLPLAYFKEHGISDYETYLKETYFTGTHEAAIYDVLDKKADVGAAKNTIYKRISDADSRIKNELVILEKSPKVPENGLAVRRNLDNSLKQDLKAALLRMHEDPTGKEILRDFGARRFIETRDEDYKPVFRYAREIDLDLATYDYVNQ